MTFDETKIKRDGSGKFAEKPPVAESDVDLEEEEDDEDEICSECGDPTDDGEGYDGLCGSCADRAESAGKFSDETDAVPLEDLGLDVGDTLQVPESDHGDADLGEITIGRDEQGYYATGGPDVYLYAAVPDVVDVDVDPTTDFEDDYLDARHHRLVAFAQDRYAGHLDLQGFETHDGARVEFTTRLNEDDDTSTVTTALHERTGVDTLVADLSQGSEVNGRTAFSRNLAEHLRETDEAAKTPREAKVPDGARFTQAQLDYAVSNARAHIPVTRSVTKAEYRTGFTIVENEDRISRDPASRRPMLGVYKDDAWTPPTQTPLLPWSAPVGTPVAHVDRDGHADLVEDRS